MGMDELEANPADHKEVVRQIAHDFRRSKAIVLAGRMPSVYTRNGEKLPTPIHDANVGTYSSRQALFRGDCFVSFFFCRSLDLSLSNYVPNAHFVPNNVRV